MDVFEAIKTRKSVRSYLQKPIEQEKLNRILEAVRLAPSAANFQEWRFVIARDAEVKHQLAASTESYDFIAEADAVIACCAENPGHVMPCGIPSYTVDVSIAIDHLTLAAVAEGLGTCWIGAFDPEKAKNAIGAPENVVIVELLSIGYPADTSIKQKSRIAVSEFVRYDRW